MPMTVDGLSPAQAAQVQAISQASVAALAAGAPAALDSFAEFANAIDNNASYAATVATSVASKQPGSPALSFLANASTANAAGIRSLIGAASAAALGADITGNVTLTAADSHTRRNVTAAAQITLNVGAGIDDMVLVQAGAGAITLVGSADIQGDTATTAQWQVMSIVRRGVDAYVVKAG